MEAPTRCRCGSGGFVGWLFSGSHRSTPSIAPAQAAIRPVAVATSADSGRGRPAPRLGAIRTGSARRRQLRPLRRPVAGRPRRRSTRRGQAAFYATVLHAPGREGIFLAEAGRVAKIAAFGDAAPGGGTLAGFSQASAASAERAGHVAFVAQVGGGRSTEGIFLAGDDGLQVGGAGGRRGARRAPGHADRLRPAGAE